VKLSRYVLPTAALAAALSLAPMAHADREGGVEADGGGDVRSSIQSAWVDGPMITGRAANADGDPVVSMSADGTVRQADMADAHRPSMMAKPQGAQELSAIGQSWGKSLCHNGEASWHQGIGDGSERCRDRGR